MIKGVKNFKQLVLAKSKSWMFLLAFFLELIAFHLTYQRFIFPALINFNILFWFEKNYIIKILSAISLIILAGVFGQNAILEALFLCFLVLSLIFFRNLLSESFINMFVVTLLFIVIYTFFAGIGVLWTFNGLIANMIITYIMLKIMV